MVTIRVTHMITLHISFFDSITHHSHPNAPERDSWNTKVLRTRPIIVERRVTVDLVDEYDIPDLLTAISCEAILDWCGNA